MDPDERQCPVRGLVGWAPVKGPGLLGPDEPQRLLRSPVCCALVPLVG